MRRFNSAGQLQRFASVHGVGQNLYRVGRHLLQAVHNRLLRTRAFADWGRGDLSLLNRPRPSAKDEVCVVFVKLTKPLDCI